MQSRAFMNEVDVDDWDDQWDRYNTPHKWFSRPIACAASNVRLWRAIRNDTTMYDLEGVDEGDRPRWYEPR